MRRCCGDNINKVENLVKSHKQTMEIVAPILFNNTKTFTDKNKKN